MSTDYTLQKGDWLDVVDDDGIWNVAQVLRLPTPDTVEVTYDGWGSEYDEEVELKSERIAPVHTHTTIVKCWAKMETWPWWPALVTIRAPGSTEGSKNLRLEERLLVDFLDREEFSDRCRLAFTDFSIFVNYILSHRITNMIFRCWVEKSKILPYNLDESTQTKLGPKSKKSKSKGEAKFRNLELSTNLLASCDAKEEFPKFVEGTLPVQYKKKVTRPTSVLRKEMGEEEWMRGFADNRIKHAITHAYMPEFPKAKKIWDIGTTTVEKTRQIPTKIQKVSHDHDKKSYNSQIEVDVKVVAKMPKSAKVKSLKSAKKTCKTLKRSEDRKNPRIQEKEKLSVSANTSRFEAAKSSCGLIEGSRTQETQHASDFCKDDQKSSLKVDIEQIKVSLRKYGKTPKLLKSSKKSAAYLPLYTPSYARVLKSGQQKAKPHSHHNRRACRSPCSKKTMCSSVSGGVDIESLPNFNRQVQQTKLSASNGDVCRTNSTETVISPLVNLAQLTKSTLRVEKKLHGMETALECKLTEYMEKSAEAKQLQNECAAMHSETQSSPTPSIRAQSCPENLQRVHDLVAPETSISVSEPQKNFEGIVWRESMANRDPDGSQISEFAKESCTKSSIRELELVLDDVISSELNHSLVANPTFAEFEAVKAEVLRSSKVQAAIAHMKHSYNFTDGFRRAGEEANLRFGSHTPRHESFYQSPRYLNKNVTLWEYEHGNELNVADSQNAVSLLFDSSPTMQGGFTFSVNDNFSMDQWYQDLYPKTFELQRQRY
ncbi:putative PWWP domain-containing protein [Plasmopara halstedii]